MPTLPLKTRIEYYKDDIQRWENIDDILFKNIVKQLREAVVILEKELEDEKTSKYCKCTTPRPNTDTSGTKYCMMCDRDFEKQ